MITPPHLSLVHGNSYLIDLSANFVDDDSDIITIEATCSFNGGTAFALPSGIFTIPNQFIINVASTSIADTGTYSFTIKVSDPWPQSVTSTFTLAIKNVAPKAVIVPPNHSVVHSTSLLIDLTSNFADDDLDPITMTATYSFNGGGAVALPSGIFSYPNPF